MPDIANMSLKQLRFTPNVFTPIEYKYQGEDLSILERSLAQREARTNKAYEEKNKIDIALGQIESQLNEQESEWFQEYKQNIVDDIQNSIDVGNPGAAYRQAITAAGNIVKDPALQGRIKANEAYKNTINKLDQQVASGYITSDTRDWIIGTNPYSYEDKYDANGNVIAGNPWNLNKEPVKDMSPIEAVSLAYKTINADKIQRGGSSINEDGTIGSYRSAYEEVTEDEIRNQLKSYLSSGIGKQQAEQFYKSSVYKYKQSRQKYEDLVAQEASAELIEAAKANMDSANAGVIRQNGQIVDDPVQFYLAASDTFIKNAANKTDTYITDISGLGSTSRSTSGNNSGTNFSYNIPQQYDNQDGPRINLRKVYTGNIYNSGNRLTRAFERVYDNPIK